MAPQPELYRPACNVFLLTAYDAGGASTWTVPVEVIVALARSAKKGVTTRTRPVVVKLRDELLFAAPGDRGDALVAVPRVLLLPLLREMDGQLGKPIDMALNEALDVDVVKALTHQSELEAEGKDQGWWAEPEPVMAYLGTADMRKIGWRKVLMPTKLAIWISKDGQGKVPRGECPEYTVPSIN